MTAQKPDSTGSGVYLSQMVAALARKGHEQAVICGLGRDDEPVFPEGVRVFSARFETEELPFPVCGMSDVMPYEATRYRDMTPEMAAQFDRAFSRVVDEAVEAFRPELIVCNHLYFLTSIVCERVEGVPVVGICHATCLRQLMTNPFQAERITAAIPKLARIFALHETQRHTIARMFEIDEDRVDVLGTGYDDAVFKRDDSIERLVHPKHVVYAGKISNAKGVGCLMRALRLLPINARDLEVRCFGSSGDYAEFNEIQRFAKLSPYRVRFMGRATPEELASEYQRADTFILPSFYEGLPLVTIEALACGCKAVCCDWPGVRSWMEERAADAPIRYVALPNNLVSGEEYEGELRAFEGRLAEALEASLADDVVPCDMSGLTWDALAERFMGFVERAL